jgi:putative redox protein
MSLKLDWVKGLQFVASDDDGHGMIIESTKEGVPTGFNPMQLLLIAQAGCMAMDVVSILQKKRLNIESLQVLMDGKRADQHPRRYTEMSFIYEFKGDVTKTAVDEAIKLSEEKYCSVGGTIKNGAKIKIESRVGT